MVVVNLLHYKCHKKTLSCDGPFADFLDWIENKKATINHINDDDKCFQYVATVALNHEKIGKILPSIAMIKPLMKKYY